MKPGDRVAFRDPVQAREHDLAEGAVGRVVEVMALVGEGEHAVVDFAEGRVVAGIDVGDLVPAEG